jgi:hypothetical protein
MTNKRIFTKHRIPSGGTALASIAFALALNVLVSTGCHAASQSQPQPPAPSSEAIGQSLVAKERLSWELAIKGDAASYKAFHAPDFFTASGKGFTGKALSESSAMDPNVHFETCDLSGFNVHAVADNAMLITYLVKASGIDHGKAFQLNSFASSLWMKREGQWVNVFYQSTPATQ